MHAKRRLVTFASGRLRHLLKIGQPFKTNFVKVKLSNHSRSLRPVGWMSSQAAFAVRLESKVSSLIFIWEKFHSLDWLILKEVLNYSFPDDIITVHFPFNYLWNYVLLLNKFLVDEWGHFMCGSCYIVIQTEEKASGFDRLQFLARQQAWNCTTSGFCKWRWALEPKPGNDFRSKNVYPAGDITRKLLHLMCEPEVAGDYKGRSQIYNLQPDAR